MSRIPGLDIFNPPEAENRPPEVFGNFSPKPAGIRNIRSVKDFNFISNDKIKANATFAKYCDVAHSREVSLVIYEENQDPDDELTDIFHEFDIISDLDHENVLKFYEVISAGQLTELAFVFESHVSLLSDVFAEKIENVFKPVVIKTIMKDIFSALQFLHKNRTIHRDIQPENIAISSTGVLKVWNFQNALKFGHRPKNLKINEFRYHCIELLMQFGKYNESVDIWSANCIFAQLWLKKPLFPEHGAEKVCEAICRLLGFPVKEVWEEFFTFPGVEDMQILSRFKYNMLDTYFKKHCDQEVSPSAMNLMHKCFRYNPKLRLKAELCLMHPYFSEEPEACPREEIVTLLENHTICNALHEMKLEKKI